MAQETVTEFRTVEEQKTRTLCDNCNRTDEEAEILTVAINPKVEKESWEEVKIIETYEDITVAEKELNNLKLAKAHDTMNYGVGKVTHNHHKNMKASAKADVCSQCVFDLFGIEIPEDEEVEEIELDEGELNINTSKEVTSVWPRFNISLSNDSVISGTKTRIFSWPVLFISCLYDVLFDFYPGNEERTKGVVEASLGAMLWTAIVLGVLWAYSFLVFAF